ncbi:MAG: YdcF family protein [Rhodobiaceae bacterium]|nr:YdcF family protein [Rhodobiaceae bacterium]MCC0012339.1 YdcF family protein [Rhodobiaceae bacterium]MCC0019095.1 YdcF family protein [Rhodobiaceae bacterium]MCC0051943.1 YdcF family protein [Rhodobiaceae bacterium]
MAVTTDNGHNARIDRSQPERTRMAIRAFSLALGLLAVAGLIGLLKFAGNVSTLSRPLSPLPRADGIVVLTGGADRIADAVALLTDSRGKRLLISGVNRATTRRDIRRAVDAKPELFRCCIDLGYSALNTFGNAVETGEWANRNGFHSLIVVTSGYHMPRTLMELSRAMPEIELIPHPVSGENLDFERWWADRRTATLMAKEYAKYVLALVRIRLRVPNVSSAPVAASADS